MLIHEMRPAALEGRGLAAALRDYATNWLESAEIPVEIHVQGAREVPLDVERALFGVAQEALANVAKHSGAKHAEANLSYNARSLTLVVADDGRGFDPVGLSDGFGLQSMRERVERLGGHLSVESAPDKGARAECFCPLKGPVGEP